MVKGAARFQQSLGSFFFWGARICFFLWAHLWGYFCGRWRCESCCHTALVRGETGGGPKRRKLSRCRFGAHYSPFPFPQPPTTTTPSWGCSPVHSTHVPFGPLCSRNNECYLHVCVYQPWRGALGLVGWGEARGGQNCGQNCCVWFEPRFEVSGPFSVQRYPPKPFCDPQSVPNLPAMSHRTANNLFSGPCFAN